MSYVYIKSELGLWTVGFYDPKGKWHCESDHVNKDSAAVRVHYLNGGTSADLLAALDGIIGLAHSKAAELERTHQSTEFSAGATAARKKVEQARAAIAKATGN